MMSAHSAKCHQKPFKHPFFECPFLAYSWRLCRLKLGITVTHMGNIQDEAEVIRAKFKKKRKSTILSRIVLCAILWHWHIWRSARVIQPQERQSKLVFRSLSEDVREIMMTCNWKSDWDGNMSSILSIGMYRVVECRLLVGCNCLDWLEMKGDDHGPLPFFLVALTNTLTCSYNHVM